MREPRSFKERMSAATEMNNIIIKIKSIFSAIERVTRGGILKLIESACKPLPLSEVIVSPIVLMRKLKESYKLVSTPS